MPILQGDHAMKLSNSILVAVGVVGAVAPAAAQDLTISIWGGGYAEEFRDTIVVPFEEAHDVEVALQTGLSGERLARILATRGRGTDLVYFTDHQMAELAAEGLLQPMNPDALTNLDEIAEFAQDPLGGGMCPAFTVAAVGLAYNGEIIDAPTSWSDLFRDDLPAKAGFTDISISYGPLLLAQVAEMEGGGIDNIAPAFEKVAAHRDQMEIFTGREILNAINQGDVALAPHLNIFVQRDESVPLRFAFPEEGGLGVLNLACMVEGSENAELAAEFIDFHLSHEIQTQMMNRQGEGTVRSDVKVPEDSTFSLISPEEAENLRFFDVQTLVDSREEWIGRWQEEIIAR